MPNHRVITPSSDPARTGRVAASPAPVQGHYPERLDVTQYTGGWPEIGGGPFAFLPVVETGNAGSMFFPIHAMRFQKKDLQTNDRVGRHVWKVIRHLGRIKVGRIAQIQRHGRVGWPGLNGLVQGDS